MKGLVVIPARGGSKGIPKKNVRLMAGKPLLSYSISTAQKSAFDLDIVVSTDDDEILQIAEMYGASTIKRESALAEDQITLDPVIYHANKEMEESRGEYYDYVITMQPTSPLLTPQTLDEAINHFFNYEFDTVISGVNDPHLAWTEKNGETIPLYEKRVNRQELPKNLIETGAFVITKRKWVQENSRLGKKISVYEMPENEAVDIDGPHDWWVAEKELAQKNILIRTEGYAEIGLGHIYRSLLLAQNLIDHKVRLVLSNRSVEGIQKVKASHFPYEIIEKDDDIMELADKYQCDILVNDILDTDKDYIKKCQSKNIRVVNMEDLGEGGLYADAVINDLYEKKNNHAHFYWGSKYYCIRDEFLLANPTEFRDRVQEVLIIFGGTDPSDLTGKVFESIRALDHENIHYQFIVGMGYKYKDELEQRVKESKLNISMISDVKRMTEHMGKADVAISSQGRTMLELACMEVPTILLAQNEREQHHEFGYLQNGFINLGLGRNVDSHTVSETLNWLINSPQVRKQMKEQMAKTDLKHGLNRVLNIITNQEL